MDGELDTRENSIIIIMMGITMVVLLVLALLAAPTKRIKTSREYEGVTTTVRDAMVYSSPDEEEEQETKIKKGEVVEMTGKVYGSETDKVPYRVEVLYQGESMWVPTKALGAYKKNSN